MIGIVCEDVAASLSFYRLLGLDFPAGAEREPHVEAVLDNGVRLAFDSAANVRSFDPRWRPGHGSVGLAFLCDSPSDVDKRHDELVAAGHHSHQAPWDAPWGQRYATVHDPDGNGVDLFCWQ